MISASALRLLFVAGIVCPFLARANVSVYTDQTAFLAAAGAQNTFGFGSVDPTLNYSNAAGVTVDGVNFAGQLNTTDYYEFVEPVPGYFGNGSPDLVGAFTSFTAGLPNPYEYVGATTLTFQAPVKSVSFTGVLDYSDAGSGNFQVSFSNGDVYNGNQPWTLGSASQFTGFVSSTSFTSLTITPGAPAANFTDPIFAQVPTLYYTPVLEDVSYAAPAPEPKGILVPGAFLLLMAVATRRATRRRTPGPATAD